MHLIQWILRNVCPMAGIVDNTAGGMPAPTEEAPTVKVIPTLPPATDLVYVDDRRQEALDLDSDKYRVIVGADASGAPRTAGSDDRATVQYDAPDTVSADVKPA